ncbi:phenylalanyl-tRNA synthetase [Guillardia theta CCMP2712]|uniref:phenylalanine--tRNA ligase n=1 Tax=Guillardia theta (strain CCMP2712) TaxID=905079 RepID=L1JLD9_GUITC|nr:phenylalanyl-tRNA synthetase [Guillardia theta CCMP2712]EKX49162.1 phenylalanyl-tRNA synthetase [Guillardia theta CCMP2712]|eukprot:XP_005836142.1 phenylalanyl-tRNA synthetase [Guillardia theta CCMP2712]
MGPKSNIVQSIASKVGRNLHRQDDHPLQIIKTWINQYFLDKYKAKDGSCMFTTFDDLSPIVTKAMCFDDLLTPEDHPSRSRQDTYYVDDDRLLRSHMTAHQTTLMREGHRQSVLFLPPALEADASPRAFLCTGDVYRRDAIDSCHYPCFHQMDGVRIFSWEELGVDCHEKAEEIVLSDLKNALAGMIEVVFGKVEMKWTESYFPFTHPSLELEIFFNGKWLEERRSRETRPTADRWSRWAFGLGLERLAMILFQIPDIRLFWSTDKRFTSQFQGVLSSGRKNVVFAPFSKYPICYKDVSLWHPPVMHDNDVMEIIREVVGDSAEDVEVIDAFVHPKTGRSSKCYRISYRSMERTLTNVSA